jgi:hypothetical protein
MTWAVEDRVKQTLRNKPARFGFKTWCLCTVSEYIAVFVLIHGKGVWLKTVENMGAVGAAGANLLGLVDLLLEKKIMLTYHVFGDHSSLMKFIDELKASSNFQQKESNKRRLKRKNCPLTVVEQFKKMERRCRKIAVLRINPRFL